MKFTAQNVKPGDIVRGIGLVVEYGEPQSDFFTSLIGYVSTRNAETGQFEQSPSSMVLPHDHLVNVRRSDENFRADQLAGVEAALTAFHSGEFANDVDVLVTRLNEIANRPRHAATAWGEVYGLVDATDLPTLGADGALGLLTLLGKYSLVAVLDGSAAEVEGVDDSVEWTGGDTTLADHADGPSTAGPYA